MADRSPVAAVRLPQIPELIHYYDQIAEVRFRCRTGRHIDTAEPLHLVCPPCAEDALTIMRHVRDDIERWFSRV